jgi:hydroxymethylglutaryl-CoA reductase
MNSGISGFYKMSMSKRLQAIKKISGLSKKEADILSHNSALGLKTADMMIENVVGTTQLPVGIATNFLINGMDYLIPMSIEEPSVVAAASKAAKLARESGGFVTNSDLPVMIGQIQIVGLGSVGCLRAKEKIEKYKEALKEKANKTDSLLIKLGGGVKDIEPRIVKSKKGHMLIVHLIVDVRDAMGANAVNTMCETISPYLEELCGGEVRLRIISNLATRRLVRAKAIWSKKILGEDVVDGIIDAYNFAEYDQYRCTTHNKGIMNGIDAVAIATGNDFRAIEAGAHSYAAINGGYKPLTKYWKDKDGNLVGSIELPLAVGLVGGATKTHPVAKVNVKILNVKTAQELAEVMVCVGLANNFAALRAMVVEGIQHGHMKLHAKNIAVIAGAKGDLISRVAARLAKEKIITVTRAKEILGKLRRK